MLLRKERLAVFNKPAINSGKIYQMDLGLMRTQLDEIIRRGWIGATAFDQSALTSQESSYIPEGTPIAGALNKYTLETDSEGGMTLYGDITLSEESEFNRKLYPDSIGFSINSLVRQRIDKNIFYLTVDTIRGFDFVTVRVVPDQPSDILDSPTLKGKN